MPANMPPALAKGLQEISKLSPEIFDKFLSSLRALPAEIKQYRVFNDTDLRVDGLADGGRAVKGAAFSLLLSCTRSHTTPDEFIKEVVESFSDIPEPERPDVETLRERTLAILGIDTLTLVAHAHDVLLEHSNAFSSARIVSDIRAVFGDDVSKPPMAAVLTHMLSIVYRNSGRRETFVVALDEKDIDQMIEVLQRAKNKQDTLKNTIDASGATYIRVV